MNKVNNVEDLAGNVLVQGDICLKSWSDGGGMDWLIIADEDLNKVINHGSSKTSIIKRWNWCFKVSYCDVPIDVRQDLKISLENLIVLKVVSRREY